LGESQGKHTESGKSQGKFESTKVQKRKADETRKCDKYNDILPLKSARRDSISSLTFLGLHIWAANEPSAVLSSRCAAPR